MILKNLFIDPDGVNKEIYETLAIRYPQITCEGDTILHKNAHYNKLQSQSYSELIENIGDEAVKFYNTFKVTDGTCWRTCFLFCLNVDPKRFKMMEGYCDKFSTIYHWCVLDEQTGQIIDPHYDLRGHTIEHFTPVNVMDIKEYQKRCKVEKKEKKRRKKEIGKEYKEMLKKLSARFGGEE